MAITKYRCHTCGLISRTISDVTDEPHSPTPGYEHVDDDPYTITVYPVSDVSYVDAVDEYSFQEIGPLFVREDWVEV